MKLVIALNVVLLFSYGDTVDLAGIDIAHELMHKGQRSRAYTVAVNKKFTFSHHSAVRMHVRSLFLCLRDR